MSKRKELINLLKIYNIDIHFYELDEYDYIENICIIEGEDHLNFILNKIKNITDKMTIMKDKKYYKKWYLGSKSKQKSLEILISRVNLNKINMEEIADSFESVEILVNELSEELK